MAPPSLPSSRVRSSHNTTTNPTLYPNPTNILKPLQPLKLPQPSRVRGVRPPLAPDSRRGVGGIGSTEDKASAQTGHSEKQTPKPFSQSLSQSMPQSLSQSLIQSVAQNKGQQSVGVKRKPLSSVGLSLAAPKKDKRGDNKNDHKSDNKVRIRVSHCNPNPRLKMLPKSLRVSNSYRNPNL
jgi:hypothetical protein